MHPFELKIKGNQKGILPNVFVGSDFHYSHKNICRATTLWRNKNDEIPLDKTRDYKSLEMMNEAIISGINNTVGQDDIFFMVGDLAFGGAEKVNEFLKRIVCKNKYLIYGNHDSEIAENELNLQDHFIACYSYLRLCIGKNRFIVSHYPIVSHHGLNKAVMQLFGHVHLSTEHRFGPGKQMDIGIDGSPLFRPYNLLTECVPLLINRPNKSWLMNDHHVEEFTI